MAVGVLRRIGGLEMLTAMQSASTPVLRRIGGLEKYVLPFTQWLNVLRRIGGLEMGNAGHDSGV